MKYIKKYGMIGGVVILMIVSVFINSNGDTVEEISYSVPIEQKEVDNYIYVDVKGYVVQPGVYKLKVGSRLFQVIENAGGFLEEADTKNVNLSILLSDQMMVYIPSINDTQKEDASDSIPIEIDDGLININTANQGELETLPGIGPSTALSIIEYRSINGSFREIEEIMNVSGIGESTFETIRYLIKV